MSVASSSRNTSSAPHNLWHLAQLTFHSFNEHDCPLRAAALAYHALLSLFPLILFLIYLGSRVLATGAARAGLEYYLDQAVPEVADTIELVIEQTLEARGSAGLIGFLALLWSASGVFTVLESALNAIWGGSHRVFWKRRVLGVASVLGVTVLLMATMALSALPAWAQPLRGTVLERGVVHLLEIALAVIFSWLLYLLLPNRRVNWRASLMGAALAGLLWKATRTIFSGFLVFALTSYGLLYGSLAWVVALALLAYLSGLILFLGAELGGVLQREVIRKR